MEGNKVRVGAVSYRNTLPLLEGMKDDAFQRIAAVSLEYPANLAAALRNNELDVALLPVAALGEIPGAGIVGDYCIAADGPVASVAIFAEKPLHQLSAIYLDYQSRSSVRLAQLLMQDYWKLQIPLLPAPEDYISKLSGSVGGVVIGDRALELLGHYPYVYDLAEAWNALTGLPFIFAAWVANKPLSPAFVTALNKANRSGLAMRNEIADRQHFSAYDLREYYNHNICYERTPDRMAGLERFLQMIAA